MASMRGIIPLGPWGGPGGNRSSFKTDHGIAGITINVGENIKSISFKDASGDVSGTFGGRNPNDFGEGTKIEFGCHSEHLKAISGTYGNYEGVLIITSLSFTTNLNNYGPFGNSTGTNFSISVGENEIVGFHGRCDYYLNSIGVFVQLADSSIECGLWGGGGGTPFSFKMEKWIKEIIVRAGGCIISVAFKDSNGKVHGQFGGLSLRDEFEEEIIQINGPSEYLTSLAGTFGYYNSFMVITSLTFITNLNTHGPFGTVSGTSFSSTPAEGGVIIGFHGRAGSYLDAIGTYLTPLHSSTF